MLLLFLLACITLAHVHSTMVIVGLDGDFTWRRGGWFVDGLDFFFVDLTILALAHVYSTMDFVGLVREFFVKFLTVFWGSLHWPRIQTLLGTARGTCLRWESGWHWGCFLAYGTAAPLVGLFLLHDSPAALSADRVRDLPHLFHISILTCSYQPLHLSSLSIPSFGLSLYGLY